YKIIEVGNISYFYVYDPNYPYNQSDFSSGFRVAMFDISTGVFEYNGGDCIYDKFVKVKKVYLPSGTIVDIHCPVNVTITDQYGRIIADNGTNEIPNATMIIINDTKTFYLPSNLTYSVEITAYGTGTFNFTKISPVGSNISITKFTNIPVTNNTVANIEIEPNATTLSMNIDCNGDGYTDEEREPDIMEMININQPPTASFTYYPQNPTTADSIQFTDLSNDPDGSIVNWTWSFGDGNISHEQNPQYQYVVNGVYNVTLTVRDDNGITDRISKLIIVTEPPTSQPMILLLVNKTIYPQIQNNLSIFRQDLYNEGYQTSVVKIPYSYNIPPIIKNIIRSYYNQTNLLGTILIGNIAAAYTEIKTGDYSNPDALRIWISLDACDMYYMDLDGDWEHVTNPDFCEDAPPNVVECHTYSSCETFRDEYIVSPSEENEWDYWEIENKTQYQAEIWISRIMGHNLNIPGENESDIINAFLVWDHKYRIGEYDIPERVYLLNAIGSDSNDQGMNYSGIFDETIRQGNITKTNYVNYLKNGSKLFYLTAHSWPQGHSLYDTSVTVDELISLEKNAVFYMLNACSSCRWDNYIFSTNPNYLGGVYLFDKSHENGDYGLCAMGFTGVGGFNNLKFFTDYLHSNKNSIYGNAFRYWFNQNLMINFGPHNYVLLGDPTIRPHPFNVSSISFVKDETNDKLIVASTDAGLDWGNVLIQCFNGTHTAKINMTGSIQAGDTIYVRNAGLFNNVTVNITWIPTSTLVGQFNFSIALPQYTLTTQVSPSNAGYITLNPSGGIYDAGTIVTVTAHANEGYVFDHWGGDASGTNSTINITMNENKSIIAYFIPIQYTFVNITPCWQQVNVNDTFIVNITIDPAVAITGVQCDLFFNASLLEVIEVQQGNLFNGYDTFFNNGSIDNINGKINDVYGAIIVPGGNVSNYGTFAKITFRARKEGVAYLNLSDVIVGDVNAKAVAIEIHNGSVEIVSHPWDLNHDNTVNILDLIMIAMHFGSHEGEAGYDAGVDLNNDKEINILDLIIVAMHFGESY
ncbi:MAG: PKD domain-containing protein, partial [Thermoplasmata archaeon]|nr:PKD domain-containing protein [Thermoplasmata archaeon]